MNQQGWFENFRNQIIEQGFPFLERPLLKYLNEITNHDFKALHFSDNDCNPGSLDAL